MLRLYVRFATAWAALVFAGQLPAGQPISAVTCLLGGPGDGWWIRADLTLQAAREMISVGSGDIYLPRGDDLVRDHPWSAPGDQKKALELGTLRSVPLLDLIRAAGLHPCPPRPLAEVVLLLPGFLVAGVALRAMDLELDVSYRPVELRPLFDPESGDARTCYEMRLRAGGEAAVPSFLVAALDRDPFILVCRRAGETLLIRDQLAAPLTDGFLASLTGEETWVLADAGYGCARLRPLGEPREGISLIGRGADHELTDISREAIWTGPAGSPAEPSSPGLALVPAGMSGVPVDATLLDDADLECLPALLAGEPLAESAVIISGRNRHLLTAPGGLLEQLPVGEPLYCLGPGNLYLPLGFRIRPALPASARAVLFPTDASAAIVLLPRAALRFGLAARRPVWTQWAGPVPPVDDQLPEAAETELRSLDSEMTSAKPGADDPATGGPALGSPIAPAGGSGQAVPQDRPEGRPAGPGPAVKIPSWRDRAYEAELAGDLVTAAELHLEHNDLLRAARLYERAAEGG